MRNIRVPANLDCAKRANDVVQSIIDEITAEGASRKKPSYRQELQKERLQGLLACSTFNESDLHKFANLLDPKVFSKKVKDLKKQYASLSKDELASRLAETALELEIEQGFAEVTKRSLDQLEHIVDGDEYRKNKANDNRQNGRNENFKIDEDRMLEVLIEFRQKYLPSALSWLEFPEFTKMMIRRYPKPAFEHEVRVVGQHKKLKGDALAAHKKTLREEKNKNPWGTRLRDFYQERNNLGSPKIKNAS